MSEMAISRYSNAAKRTPSLRLQPKILIEIKIGKLLQLLQEAACTRVV